MIFPQIMITPILFLFWGMRQLFFFKGEIHRKINFYLVNTEERDEIIAENQYPNNGI